MSYWSGTVGVEPGEFLSQRRSLHRMKTEERNEEQTYTYPPTHLLEYADPARQPIDEQRTLAVVAHACNLANIHLQSRQYLAGVQAQSSLYSQKEGHRTNARPKGVERCTSLSIIIRYLFITLREHPMSSQLREPDKREGGSKRELEGGVVLNC